MLNPETTVEHLDQAMRMLAAAIESPNQADRESLLEGSYANLVAIWDAEIRCNCNATTHWGYWPHHLISCPVRHDS